MKKILATIVISTLAFTTYAQNWTTVKLLDNVTVSLPGSPKEDKSKGMPMQKVVLDDSTEIYAGAIDYSLFGMDESMLQKMAGTDEFKQQMETGISAQPGVTLVKNEGGKYADKYYSYDMVLDIDKGGKKATVNTRTVFYKQYGISVTYKPGMKGENAEIKNKALNSIKITE